MGLKTYLVNFVTSFLPPTRFYKQKAIMYKIAGYDIHKSARIVSSSKIWGEGQRVITESGV